MKITDAATFGAAIRQRRKSLHYTQAQLAEFSGLSTSFLSDLENGKPTCSLEKALFVLNLLGMDCEFRERGDG